MKTILFFLAWSLTATAYGDDAKDTNKMLQQFEAKKAKALQGLEKRRQMLEKRHAGKKNIVDQAKACVSAASGKADIKNCRKQKRSQMQEMRQQHRNKAKEMKKKWRKKP